MQEFLNGFNIFLKFLPIAILVVLIINAIKRSIEGWNSKKPYSKMSVLLAIIISLIAGAFYYYVSKGNASEFIFIQILSIITNATYIWCLSINFYEIMMKGIFSFVDNFFKKLSNNSPNIQKIVEEKIEQTIEKK